MIGGASDVRSAEIVSGAELPVHPFASVTVTVKVPVDVTSIVEVNLLFDQE